MPYKWMGLGFMVDVILREIELTPEIEATLGPMIEFQWECVYDEHPKTIQRGAYEDGALIAVEEYCTACTTIVRKRQVIGYEEPNLWPKVLTPR